MNTKHVLAGTLLLALVACGGGGGGGGTEPTNEAPVLRFVTTDIAVPKSVAATLTITASDPDGDALTITWDITRGTVTPQNGPKTIAQWTVPATTGVDTVTVKASDGTTSTTLTAEIKVGTRWTSSFLPATLSLADSPYILAPGGSPAATGVEGGSTTVIEPGVELLVDVPNMRLDAVGTLEAHGTEEDPIVIRPNDRTFTCATDEKGWWQGIKGAESGFVDLEHVVVRNARWGIRLSDNSSALLQDCEVLCTSDAGVLLEGNGSLRALDSRITDGGSDGIAVVAPVSLPDSIRIVGCNLSYNGNAGIRMDLKDTSQAVPIVVEYNQIEFNASYGIVLSNSVFPAVHYNAFRGNGESSPTGLYLTSGYPGTITVTTLDATCNFWGVSTTSQATIDQVIRDQLDTGTVKTRVITCPWLNANPLTTPPVCNMACP